MPPNALRIAAYCAWLGAWAVFALAAAAGAIPALRRQARRAFHITAPAAIGALLQISSALALTLSMTAGPLRTPVPHLAVVAALSPLAAALFVWSMRSAPAGAGPDTLVTTGAYARLRHPIYLAFLLMLLATGLLVAPTPALVLAIALYLAGSEFRINDEERDLAARHGAAWAQYRARTRWRYLPGIR